MLAILIFILAYIYSEKIKSPTASRIGKMFKKLQLLSSAAFSIGHGGNDAQKVMGIISAAIIQTETLPILSKCPIGCHWHVMQL